jgi:hypothetical protein
MNFVTPKGGQMYCPERAARFHKVMMTPANATPRDIYVIIFGAYDAATKAKHRDFLFTASGADVESVRDFTQFNPRYYNLSRQEAMELGDDGAFDLDDDSSDQLLGYDARAEQGNSWRVEYFDLWLWQRKIVDRLLVAEHPKFGRKVLWIWEPTGRVGKTVLASHLIDACGAVEVTGTSRDALYTIAEYVQSRGEGPPIVIFDVPRSNDGINYETVEKAKDGKFYSSKYQGVCIRYARPHVVCFANEPPQPGMLSQDRYDVIRLGVDMDLDRFRVGDEGQMTPTPAAAATAVSTAAITPKTEYDSKSKDDDTERQTPPASKCYVWDNNFDYSTEERAEFKVIHCKWDSRDSASASGGSGSGSGGAVPRHRLARQVRRQSVQRIARRAQACGSPCCS